MRRQVRPFVTEYRGNARRSRDLPKDLTDTSDQPGNVVRGRLADGQRGFATESLDDSYEAAMRAADALFAPAPPRQDPLPSAPEPVAAYSAPSAASLDGDVTAAIAEPDGARPEPPRRILQAIEPASEDRFAALEAERAPKRRGRKPGSKNKPKVVVSDDWAAQPSPVPLARHAARPIDLFETAAPTGQEAAADGDDLAPLPDDAAMPTPRGRSERFGWKRSGLRPGERWKRRLPKIAW